MSSLCQNTSLDSPLINCILQEAIDTWKSGSRPRNNRIKAIIYDLNSVSHFTSIKEDASNFVQYFSGLLSTLEDNPIQEAVDEWTSIFDAACPIITAKTKILVENFSSFQQIKEKCSQIRNHPCFPALMSHYSFRWVYENLTVATSRPKNVTQKYQKSLNPHLTLLNPGDRNPVFYFNFRNTLEFYATSSFLIINDAESQSQWCVSRDYLLQLLDCATQRYTTLITSMYAEIIKDVSIPKPQDLLWYFEWGDDILDNYGNEGYKSLKNWEPLVTSFILNYEKDPHVNTMDFMEFIKKEFIESQGAEEEVRMEMRYCNLRDKLLEDSEGNPDILSQLFGLYRIWGHPTVDGLDGVNALTKITTHLHTLNHHSIRLVTRKWREYFSMSYYSSERKWPAFREDTLLKEESLLVDCIKNNRPLDRQHPQYFDSDWDNIRFAQTFEVPRKFEFTEMISDKATSLDSDTLKSRCELYGDIGKSEDRSVIIRWLRCNENNPLEFLQRIGAHGFSPKTKLCGVYPKEREGKNKPRLFGLMPLERRLYIVLTEALIADFILKYFPEITMTYDQSTLLTRLNQVTKNLNPSNEGKTSIVTNIDFEKWNSNMRSPETFQLFSDFDDLFGLTNVFSRSHEVFEECQFYLADGSITPRWIGDRMIEGPGVWSNHLGGIEGMRQKGWTVFTVVLLKYVCEYNQVPFQLMGQGDNQVLICTYYPKETISIARQHQIFLDHLNQFLSTIGPPIKLDESWSSSRFLTYGKFPILSGVPLSMSLKRLSRCSRLNNDGLVNLDSVLSSLSANASAAISLSKNPITPLLLIYMETLAAINLHLIRPFYGPSLITKLKSLNLKVPGLDGRQLNIKENISRSLSKKLQQNPWIIIQNISMVPSALGGFPVPMIFDLLMHGFPDPVTASIWECKEIYHILPNRFNSLKRGIIRTLMPRFNGIRNPELLCQDPTCLNLLRGSRPKDQIKRMVFNFLSHIPDIENEAFQSFFLKAQEQQKELAEALFAMRPLHPRVCASIYESTPVGVAQAITRKIQSTRTLEKMMVSTKDHESIIWTDHRIDVDDLNPRFRPKTVSELQYMYEINQINSILLIFNRSHITQDVIQECSVTLAKEWREQSWGVELRGVTVAFPRELLIHCEGVMCDDHPNSTLGYIRCQTTLDDNTLRSSSSTIGPFKPFFGSSTSEKIKYEGGKLVKASPPLLKTALQNLRLINWGTSPDSNLAKLIISTFSSITDLPWELLIPKPGGVTGSIEHRWADTKTEHGVAPSISYTTSTHFTVNTNQFKPELKDEHALTDNVNINHQSIFSAIAMYNQIQCIYSNHIDKTAHWHINCPSCIDYINEELMDILDEDLILKAQESLVPDVENPFMWISRNDFTLTTQQLPIYSTLSADNYMDDWDPILALSMVDWVLTNNSICSDKSQEWQYYERQLLVPISIVGKLNIKTTLYCLTSFMLLLSFYNRCAYWSTRFPSVDINFILQMEIQKLGNLSHMWFRPLISLFLTANMCDFITTEVPGVSPPKDWPPSETERSICIKSIIIELMHRIGNKETLRRFCGQISTKVLVKSSCVLFHPEIIRLIYYSFHDDDSSSQSMKYLAQIREKQRDLGAAEWSNGISIISEIDNQWRADPILTQVVKDVQNVSLLDISPDYASRKVGQRTHPSSSYGCSNQITIPWKNVRSLPPSTHHYFYHPKTLSSGVISEIEVPCLQHIPSSINHLFKSSMFVTTAPYKLLSILHFTFLYDLINFRHVETILCCADGVGGFSALLCQIFPAAKIIYNSYFNVRNQSSVGCDSSIPAALMSQRVARHQVLGLHYNVEGESDITKQAWVDDITRQYHLIDMVVCDAEGEGTRKSEKSKIILENLVTIARMSKTKLLIIKSYLSRMDVVMCQTHVLSCYYHKVNVVRSTFSGYCNTEVYLVASGRRQTPYSCQWILSDCDRHTLSGDIPNSHDVNALLTSLQKLPLDNLAESLSEPYSDCLKLNDSITLPGVWKSYFDSLSLIDEPKFPTDLVRFLKEEFSLVKFNPQSKTHLRKHLLTVHISRKLLHHYLLWVFWNQHYSVMLNFERKIEPLVFIVYETMSHHWSMTIDLYENRAYGRKWKAWKLTTLTNQQFWKDLYSVMREGKRYSLLKTYSFQWRMCGAKDYPHRVGLITDHTDWKRKINEECTSVSNLPCPYRGEKINVCSGITKCNNPDEMEEDILLLTRVLDEGTIKGNKEELVNWINQRKIVTPCAARMEKCYRFYLNHFDLFKS